MSGLDTRSFVAEQIYLHLLMVYWYLLVLVLHKRLILAMTIWHLDLT